MAAPSEKTPLVLPPFEIPKDLVHVVSAHRTLAMQIVHMWYTVIGKHWLGISLVFLSTLLCWRVGYAEISIVDPLIFKSLFVLFGFTIGFRNVRANQRGTECLACANRLISGFWGVYVVMPSAARQKIREPLCSALRAAAMHVHIVAERGMYGYGIVGLEPTPRAPPAPGGATLPGADDELEAAIIAPRIQILAALLLCEGQVEEVEAERKEQKLRRNFWLHKAQLLSAFDGLLALSVPSVSHRYIAFNNMCLLMFSAALPWGMSAKTLHLDAGHYIGKWQLGAGAFLMINSLIIVTVLYGIDSLTEENENPLALTADDLDLRKCAQAFALGTVSYEAQRAAAEKAVAPALDNLESIVAQHELLCAPRAGPAEPAPRSLPRPYH